MSERLETIKSVLGNKYEIKKLIARGGMAEIYLGVHIALNKQVAIKIIRYELTDVAGSRERFLREAKLAANLDPGEREPSSGLDYYSLARCYSYYNLPREALNLVEKALLENKRFLPALKIKAQILACLFVCTSTP